MLKKTMPVKANSFQVLLNPVGNNDSKKYIFYVKVDDVPLGIPMATNPRNQKLTSSVAKAITESLLSNDGNFYLKNRGIILSASKLEYDPERAEVTVYFDNTLCHGNIDGGHTYRIICEYQGKKLNQYVQFEVMTGVEGIIENLAEARNTSVQVDEKSMAELARKFDPIKEGLEGMPFFDRIAFKQNQVSVDETGKNLKMIDAREVVAIINMFNIEKYDAQTHPMQAYSSKAKMLELYLQDPEFYRKFVNVMPDIFDLYDQIEMEFADAYNSAGGRYGRKKYSGHKDDSTVGKSKFGMHDLKYKIPDGFMYPVVAAFRSYLQYNEFCLIHWRQSQCGGKRYKYLGFGIYESGIGKETGVRHMSYQVKLKVKEILEERKITQKKLAEVSGIRESTISDIVRGARTVINFEHLSKIAEALEITDIRELIDFENTSK